MPSLFLLGISINTIAIVCTCVYNKDRKINEGNEMTNNKLSKTYQCKTIEASILGDLIASGQVVRKDQTPIMQMIAAQMNYERKLAGSR